MVECDFNKFANGVSFASADDKIISGILLKHKPHSANIIASEAPISAGIEVAQAKFGLETKFDFSYCIGNFAGYEFKASARRFVIEEDARASEEAVAFAVVDGDVMAIGLCNAIG